MSEVTREKIVEVLSRISAADAAKVYVAPRVPDREHRQAQSRVSKALKALARAATAECALKADAMRATHTAETERVRAEKAEAALAAARAEIEELTAMLSRTCEEPNDDCTCAGCLALRDHAEREGAEEPEERTCRVCSFVPLRDDNPSEVCESCGRCHVCGGAGRVWKCARLADSPSWCQCNACGGTGKKAGGPL